VSVAESLFFGETPTTLTLQFVPLRVRVGRLEVHVCPGPTGWTLPGSAPDPTVTLDQAADDLAAELLGVPGTSIQLGAFGQPASGIQVVYLFLVQPPHAPRSAGRGTGNAWWDVRGVRAAAEVEPVLARTLARLEYDVEYGMAGFRLVGEEFTVSELRRVHQAVRNVELDPSNFRKRVSRWVGEGLVQELDRLRPTATRPARLYRLR
jgi:8-oxo-dGTP diphosphatase